MRSDNEFLAEYFSTSWLEGNRDFDQYEFSGWSLVSKINPGERVLDVGCGTNPFKKRIPNLHGIDITNVGADEVVAVEEFRTDEKFDVAFCLGSINFGSVDKIRTQIQAISNALNDNARIYWRLNPGRQDHGNDQVNQVDFFPWTQAWCERLAYDYGFECVTYIPEPNGRRYYAEWIR